MPKTHPPYSPEFRRQIVDLVRTGRDPADLARAFEPTPLSSIPTASPSEPWPASPKRSATGSSKLTGRRAGGRRKQTD